MATIKRFEDLEVWQKARLLENKIFELMQVAKLSKDFELKNQMNKSAGSIMDNIAEGFGRGSRNEFIQFLTISRGSLTELQSQLYRCFDRKYLLNDEFSVCYSLAEEVGKMLSTFIAYLNKSDMAGNKFKERVAIKK
jgi:four helix bundle protein